MLENLRKYKILLASKSPRRRELLSQLRVPFKVINQGGIDESYPADMDPEEIPIYLADKKADAYIKNLKTDELVITSDTLVILDGKVLGKPKTPEEAKEMLKSLSGVVHKVVSGVCVATPGRRITFSNTTKVKFATLSEDDIDYYVENFMPLDKAGAYGIQEWIGCVAVEWIEGSYYNVMGLPVNQLYRELKQF